MKDINLIHKISWRFYGINNGMIPYDELFSEASLQYTEAKKITPEAHSSTFYWRFMSNGLINFCKKEKRYKTVQPNMEESVKEISYIPSSPFSEFYDELPEDCKKIVDLFFDSLDEIPPNYPPKMVRGWVINLLRKEHWAWASIWNGIRDLKRILNETNDNCII